jgi:hypothetical protein
MPERLVIDCLRTDAANVMLAQIQTSSASRAQKR